MAQSTASLPLFFLFLLFLSGGLVKFGNGQEKEQSWCVAKPSTGDGELVANIRYACNELQDCSMISQGGSCYEPHTLMNHASVVMNQYYAVKGRYKWNCNFTYTGLVALENPSYSNCKYA
ncbi:hypothetical protein L6164_035454 [Bauhinia variegata]|uniref:Uncharacterized protein n=1 Tax=Bauhinia variegata TaxID=167791 RepID=A0ACB9KE05_BAUVA|nr:hypothetical protein L6164_035454 [Bauhinia variegata]